jgi:peptidoglycan/xylan/chitin deacetylase (PgdA/CDA1 family)
VARRLAKARRRRRRQRGVLAVVLAAALLAVALLSGGGSGPRSGSRPAVARAGGSHKGALPPTPRPAAATAVAAAARAGYPESSSVRALIAQGRPIYCGGRRGNEVALTFDDGPGPYTRLVIAKLRKHHVGGTFFIVGRNLPLVAGATRAERALGGVGDHTFTHPLLTGLSHAGAEAEMVRTQSAVAHAAGGPVFLFRPPYGGRDASVDGIAGAHGMLEILWSVDSRDSLGADYAQIEANVISGMRPGAIILMHENHGQTVRALFNVFAALKRKHLRAVGVAQLLTDDPPSAAQLRAGGRGCGLHGGATFGSGG